MAKLNGGNVMQDIIPKQSLGLSFYLGSGNETNKLTKFLISGLFQILCSEDIMH